MTSVVIHYGELALKGRNRPWFVNTLVRTIRASLRGVDVSRVQSLLGRVIVTLGPGAGWEDVRERLRHLPGIGNFAQAHRAPADIEAIAEGVVAGLIGRDARSFRVTARRADKRFPLSSPEIERLIGRRVQEATGWPVNLSAPQLIVHVEVLVNDAFYYFDREPGTGGLPVGTGGKVLALLSGGIDSPVAAWRLIRRGCRTHFVHFHSYPILTRASQDKARELVQKLTRNQLRSRLFLVPFGGIQQQVVLTVPAPLRVVIYRRLMLRIAERLAADHGAHALVTGDSVGQVASQTIDNLRVVGNATTMPVLRPLVGMDKEEITRDAIRIGTYETSILPDEDCCTLFTPRFPATRASLATVEAAESALDIRQLVEGGVASTRTENFAFPMLELTASSAREEP